MKITKKIRENIAAKILPEIETIFLSVLEKSEKKLEDIHLSKIDIYFASSDPDEIDAVDVWISYTYGLETYKIKLDQGFNIELDMDLLTDLTPKPFVEEASKQVVEYMKDLGLDVFDIEQQVDLGGGPGEVIVLATLDCAFDFSVEIDFQGTHPDMDNIAFNVYDSSIEKSEITFEKNGVIETLETAEKFNHSYDKTLYYQV